MEKKRGVSIWVKIFVLFHALAITIWSMPNPRRPVMLGTVEPYGTDWILYYNWKFLKDGSPLKYYTITLGTWQYWDMFSPNPASTDLWGRAEVIYQDGTKQIYPYYRIYDLPIPSKYFRERFRKFFERASNSDFNFSFAPFAQRVALLMDKDPNNPPQRVRLFKYTQNLKGPGRPIEPYRETMYYEHQVDLEALRKAEGRS